jgi:hypothetical protein
MVLGENNNPRKQASFAVHKDASISTRTTQTPNRHASDRYMIGELAEVRVHTSNENYIFNQQFSTHQVYLKLVISQAAPRIKRPCNKDAKTPHAKTSHSHAISTPLSNLSEAYGGVGFHLANHDQGGNLAVCFYSN